MNQFPPAPEYPITTITHFFENSRRYSQVKVHHRYQWQFVTGVNDTGEKIAAGNNDTGGKLATSINDTAGKFC